MNKKDSIINLNFTLDTTSTDFSELIELVKSKTEFTKVNPKEITKDSSYYLVEFLCKESSYTSPMKRTILKNVFSIKSTLVSNKSQKGYKSYFPKLYLEQLNFISEAEKDSAMHLFRRIGVGNPLKKWNDYTYVDGKKRIYILFNQDAIFQDYDEKYIKFIKENWIDVKRN